MSTLFKFWNNNNKVRYRFEKIKDVLISNISYPKCQREIKQDRIKELQNDFKKYFNPITPIYFCVWNKKRWVIDGQHRLKTYYNSQNIGNTKIPIVDIYVKNEKEISKYFMLINNQLTLPEVYKLGINEDRRDIILKTYNYFIAKYPYTFNTNHKNSVRPYLKPDLFLNQLTSLIQSEDIKLNISCSGDYINLLEELEQKYSIQEQRWFPPYDGNSKLLRRVRNNKAIHFGMIKNQWMDHFIKFPLKPDPFEGKVPPAIKKACWVRWMGNKFESKCWCCNSENISAFNFEAGHVKARVLGGKNKVLNLRPICSKCNKAMATKHMLQFMEEMDYNHLSFR